MVDIREIAKITPKTFKVYLEDPYIREIESTIMGVHWEKKDRAYITLDKTIFHPKGGGQDGDSGLIIGEGFKFNILKVLEVDDVIFHYVKLIYGSPEIVKTGLMVKCILDWEKRIKTMKLHTAGHVLDYAVGEAYGGLIETLSANHSPPEAYIEYKAEIPSEDKIRVIYNEANKIVREHRNVKCVWVEYRDLSRYTFNAPNLDRLPKADKYRIVIIEGINGIPCTGTHLSNTGEINEIKIVKIEKTDFGFKLYYDAI
ncbi:MAG: alanyl-tRNA editing protein [Candidatus Methanomethylicia archaeon]